MGEKTCCVTGHREVPKDKLSYVETELKREILTAISEGYTRFLSGFAEGVDLTFAAIVAEQKRRNGSIRLEAALPYRNRMNAKDPLFQSLIKECDHIYVEAETSSRQCYLARNRYMALESDRVIAVYDGREKGGTFYTVKFARSKNKEVRVIQI